MADVQVVFLGEPVAGQCARAIAGGQIVTTPPVVFVQVQGIYYRAIVRGGLAYSGPCDPAAATALQPPAPAPPQPPQAPIYYQAPPSPPGFFSGFNSGAGGACGCCAGCLCILLAPIILLLILAGSR